jgi:hypothetical protein
MLKSDALSMWLDAVLPAYDRLPQLALFKIGLKLFRIGTHVRANKAVAAAGGAISCACVACSATWRASFDLLSF